MGTKLPQATTMPISLPAYAISVMYRDGESADERVRRGPPRTGSVVKRPGVDDA